MAFIGNNVLSAFNMTAPAVGQKVVVFFGTIPQEFIYTAAIPTVYSAPIVQEAEEEESYFQLTTKGAQNQILESPPQPSRRRRRQNRPTISNKAHLSGPNTQVSKKRAFEALTNEMVAQPNIPVSNPFTALRVVRKNSPTGQIRRVWEVPQPKPINHYPKEGIKKANPTEAIYKAYQTLRARKQAQVARYDPPTQNQLR